MDSILYMVILVLVGIIGLFWHSQTKLKGKIFCTFRRSNKTKIEKWVSQKDKYVYFDPGKGNDKGQYIVDTKRITLLWWNRGIFQFFPMFVPSLDFSWYSQNPHNPETFEVSWDNPTTRAVAGQEDAFKAFSKGIRAQVGKTSRFPEWLFPAVTIGAVLIIGYLVYQQGEHLSYLEQLIKLGLQGG